MPLSSCTLVDTFCFRKGHTMHRVILISGPFSVGRASREKRRKLLRYERLAKSLGYGLIQRHYAL